MRIWIIRAVALSSLFAVVGVIVIQTGRGWPSGPLSAMAVGVNGLDAVTFILVGWLLSERQRSNVIGLLLIVMGAQAAWFMVGDLYLKSPEILRQWLSPGWPAVSVALWLSIGTVTTAILAYLIVFLFPDGRPPGPRWRWVVVLAVGGGLCGVAGIVFGEGPLAYSRDYSSPLAVDGFAGQGLVAVSEAVTNALRLAAAAALAVRWRRADREERAQIKWVVAASMVLIVLTIIAIPYDDPTVDQFNWILGMIINVSLAMVAVAIGIAILRYHLYAIDRIISRTIAYGIVVGGLAVVYYALVILLSGVLATYAQGGAIAVAASTLTVFAVFQVVARPVRHRVDRRFNRAHYDAEQLAVAFSIRLRDEVDLATVADDLDGTVRQAVDPTMSALWLRSTSRHHPRATTP